MNGIRACREGSSPRRAGRTGSPAWRWPALALAASLTLSAVAWSQSAAPRTQPQTQPAPDPAAEFLSSQGIGPDANGVGDYLRRAHADATNNELAATLIRQLGSDKFNEREEAVKKLLALPIVPEIALKEAARSDDAEVRVRAEQVLAESGGRTHDRVLGMALGLIQRKALKGLADPLLKLMPLYPDTALQGQFRLALRATARPEDADGLRSVLKDANSPARAAAAGALSAALGEKSRDELAALLRDAQSTVRLAAARELANFGDRRCLEELGKLLSADDVAVRVESYAILRSLTGKDFRFVGYDQPEARKGGAEAWNQWILAEGKTAALNFPLKIKVVAVLQGRTLLCSHAQEALIEVDANDVQTFRADGVPMPWGCQALPNGNRLVVSHSLRKITEYDAQGKAVWTKENLPGGPMSVQRLDSGNTLVALADAKKVVEYTPDGKVAWEADLKQECTAAQRIEGGNTLVALRKVNRVVEIDPSGKEVWKLENLKDPQAAQRLENGNTLIAETADGKVTEYDSTGHAVWTKDGLQNPLDCQRLPNGNTIVVDRAAVHEYAPDGKEVATLNRQGLSRAWRY